MFSATMSRNRFVFVRAHLSFDDEATRENRWQHDRFGAKRDVFEVFNFECMSCLVQFSIKIVSNFKHKLASNSATQTNR